VRPGLSAPLALLAPQARLVQRVRLALLAPLGPLALLALLALLGRRVTPGTSVPWRQSSAEPRPVRSSSP